MKNLTSIQRNIIGTIYLVLAVLFFIMWFTLLLDNLDGGGSWNGIEVFLYGAIEFYFLIIASVVLLFLFYNRSSLLCGVIGSLAIFFNIIFMLTEYIRGEVLFSVWGYVALISGLGLFVLNLILVLFRDKKQREIKQLSSKQRNIVGTIYLVLAVLFFITWFAPYLDKWLGIDIYYFSAIWVYPLIIASIILLFKSYNRSSFLCGIIGSVGLYFNLLILIGRYVFLVALPTFWGYVALISGFGFFFINLFLVPYRGEKSQKAIKLGEQLLNLKVYILNLPKVYQTVSFSQIRARTREKINVVKSTVEDLIIKGEINARINGNQVIFQGGAPASGDPAIVSTTPSTSTNIPILGKTDMIDYLWVICLIGAILVLISYAKPAASFLNMTHLWIWGLISSINGYGTSLFTFLDDPFTISILDICAILQIVLQVLLIIKTNKSRKYGGEGTILIIGAIISMFLIIIPVTFLEISPIFTWTIVSIGFGVFGVFIGAVLTLIGGILIQKM
ncbi:MAG: hypothetical protein ACFFAS_05915 [Promethearchaeota archaeon]